MVPLHKVRFAVDSCTGLSCSFVRGNLGSLLSASGAKGGCGRLES